MVIFFLLLSVLPACRKKEMPVPSNGSTVFRFIGTINGDSVHFQAGKDNLYMYTGFFTDTQNLVTLRSYFAPDNCTNCEPYLGFEVKDAGVSSGGFLSGSINDVFPTGKSYSSYSDDSILTTIMAEVFHFIPEGNGATSYAWDFGDSSTSNAMNPKHVFTNKGMRDVRLVVFGGGANDTILNTINTDYHSTCRTQFAIAQDSMNNVYVSTFPASSATNSWNFGNGTMGSGNFDTCHYNVPGKYTITLTSSSAGCTAVFRKKVNLSFLSQVFASYSYYTTDSTSVSLAPRLNTSAFVITWKKNGKVYQSFKTIKGIDQSQRIVFNLKGVTTYVPNEHGEKTVAVSGAVDTYLYNRDNWQDSIRMISNDVIFAAAYPD